MKGPQRWVWMALIALLMAVGAWAQNGENQGTGDVVVTVLPKHEGDAVAASVANQDLSVKVNGKNAKVTRWAQFKSPDDRIELVLLIDDSARSSLGTQLEEIAGFVKTLPPNIKLAIGYMENGRSTFAAPFSSDRQQALSALHLPGGSPGYSTSPYFCLSDLAKNWPSNDAEARREVVMVTDGVDTYQRRFDPDDPYVQAAEGDAVKAHLVVYAIYWANRGRADSTEVANNAGQNLMVELTEATGGKSFWQGMGNPVSFEPYFDELTRRLRNQYELGFVSPSKGKAEVETMKLKLSAPGDEVNAPQQVLVTPTGGPQK
ncbi:MAG TPA: hypothetical protein VMQ56_09990 [Terracidiphilus sp.]|nr:hypothetical protein [Terracidiphilus sp.]